MKFGYDGYNIEHTLFILESLPHHQIEHLRLELMIDRDDDDEVYILSPLCEVITKLGQQSLKILETNIEGSGVCLFESFRPLLECSELRDLKIMIPGNRTLEFNDVQLDTLAQKLKKLRSIHIRHDVDGDRIQTGASLRSLDSFSAYCPDIRYIGLLICDFKIPSPHRSYSRFTNDMNFEFFDSPLKPKDVFPVSLHLSTICRPSSGKPPAIVAGYTEEWIRVTERVKELHTALEIERSWGKSSTRL